MAAMDSSRTPLLADTDAESQHDPIHSTEPKRLCPITPIPKMQIFILSYGIFAEYVCFYLIYPFINEMIVSAGIANPGYLSGLVEGILPFAQTLTVFYWGSLSDRLGRKPVLVMGLMGVATFSCIFGLSSSLWMILLSRFCVGLGNGGLPVTKSSIAELTDETNQSRAFSFLSLSWSMGSIVAPLVGGYLARPAERHPKLFGSFTLLVRHPYLLACVTGAGIAVTACLLVYFIFDESLGGKRPESRTLLREEYALVLVEDAGEPAEDVARSSLPLAPHPDFTSIRDVLNDIYIRRIVVAYLFLALITISIDGVLALWLYAPLDKGGLGFNASQSGFVMSSVGFLTTLINLLVFPPLQRRIGTIPIYRFGMVLQPIVVAMLPITRYIALREQPGGSSGVGTKIALVILALVKAAGGIAYASNVILVGCAAPSKTSLGAVNGVAHMVASAMRAIGPTLATIVFALSTDVRYHALGGRFVWLYLLSLAACAVVASRRVREGRVDTRDL